MNHRQCLSALESLLEEISKGAFSEADERVILTRIQSAFETARRSRFWHHCEEASRRVAEWPEWKQNILRDSAKPMLDTPREPVSNSFD